MPRRRVARAQPQPTLNTFFTATKVPRGPGGALKRAKRDGFDGDGLIGPAKKETLVSHTSLRDESKLGEITEVSAKPKTSVNELGSPPTAATPTPTLLHSPPLRRKVRTRPDDESESSGVSGTATATPSSAKRRLDFPTSKKVVTLSPLKLPPPTSSAAKRLVAKSMKAYQSEMAASSPIFHRLTEELARPKEDETEKAEDEKEKEEGQEHEEEGKEAREKVGEKEPTPRPAHERYALLADAAVAEGMQIPEHQKLLIAFFGHADHCVCRLSNRCEAVSFPKLAQTLESVTKRKFGRDNLGQIRTVYPQAYTYRLEKTVSRFGQRSRPTTALLLIAMNTDGDLDDPCYNPHSSPSKTPASNSSSSPGKAPPPSPLKPGQASPSKRPRGEMDQELNPSRLNARKKIFRAKLFRLLKAAQTAFLAKQDPPIILSPEEESRLDRWDPNFLLSGWEVPIAALPEALAEEDNKSLSSGANFLAAAKPILSGRIQRALAEKEEAEAKKKQLNLGPSPTKKALGGLERLPASLVAEIKAKEVAGAKRNLLRSLPEAGEVAQLQRLKHYVKTLKAVAAQAKPGCDYANLRQNLLVQRLAASHPLQPAQAIQDLSLLAKVSPDFLKLLPLNGVVYYKLSITRPLSETIAEIQARLD